MGKRIDELLSYGSVNLAKSDADLLEISLNSGTFESPIYAADGSRKLSVGGLRNLLGGNGFTNGLSFADGKAKLGGTLIEDTFIYGDFGFTLSNVDTFNAYLKTRGVIAVTGDDYNNQLHIEQEEFSLINQNPIDDFKVLVVGNAANLDLFWNKSDDTKHARIILDQYGIALSTGTEVAGFKAYLRTDDIDDDYTYQFPAKGGKFAMTSDILGLSPAGPKIIEYWKSPDNVIWMVTINDSGIFVSEPY